MKTFRAVCLNWCLLSENHPIIRTTLFSFYNSASAIREIIQTGRKFPVVETNWESFVTEVSVLSSHPGRCPRWSRRMRWAWRWCPLWGPPRPGSWWTCWTPSAAASRSWPHHICIVHYILTPSYLMAWSTIPLPTAVTLDSSSSARPSTSRWGWE